MTNARLERYEAQARKLLAAGFTTKAAQKDARFACGTAFSEVMQMVRDCHLKGEHTEAGESVYFGMPSYPHEWRAKHAAMIRADLPAAVPYIEVADRLAALSAEIKAAPLNLKPRNADGTVVRVPHISETYNAALREQFMAQAPALAAEYVAQVRTVFSRYVEIFGGTVPCDPFPGVFSHKLTDKQKDQKSVILNLIGKHSDTVGKGTPAAHYMINEPLLAEEARKYGEAIAMQWFFKTNRKLGELSSASLIEDSGGFVRVTGSKDGHAVLMRQQRVIKWAPKARELYAQFPAHLYVDGNFITAYDYSVMFKTEAIED